MTALLPFPDIAPEIFSISLFGFNLALRWYALAYIVGILIAWRLAVLAVRNTALWPNAAPPMTARQVEDLLTWIIIGIIVGGRLGYTLVYNRDYYLANLSEIPMIWQGGMAFHGGLVGVIVASWIFTARHGINRLRAADLIALCVPPGLLLGRLANFINAELWGRPADVPWAVIFPGVAAQDCPGVTGPCARHPSQLYEAGLEGLLLGLVLIWLVWGRRAFLRPGLVCGVFLSGYGLARFLVEFFRQPDAQFVSPGNPLGLAWHLDGWGLTMGQILSLPMIAIGIWLILRARPVPAPA